MKFGLNFMSCSENVNFAIIAATSGIYPKISLLPSACVITIICFVKIKISDFQTCFHDEYRKISFAEFFATGWLIMTSPFLSSLVVFDADMWTTNQSSIHTLVFK